VSCRDDSDVTAGRGNSGHSPQLWLWPLPVASDTRGVGVNCHLEGSECSKPAQVCSEAIYPATAGCDQGRDKQPEVELRLQATATARQIRSFCDEGDPNARESHSWCRYSTQGRCDEIITKATRPRGELEAHWQALKASRAPQAVAAADET
jgi:hypothetical protein